MNAAHDNNSQQPQPQQVILIKTPDGAYIVANPKDIAPGPGGVPVLNQPDPNEKAAHPNICILHMFFKVISAALYFLSGVISSSSLTSGLAIIVAGAFDFWVVKNITGRYLVGLRWWTEHLSDGKEKWMFECRPDESLINKADSRIFWSGQVIYVLGGVALIVLSFFFGGWSMLIPVVFCVGQSGFNIYAFYKCSKAQQEKVKSMVDDAKNKAQNFAMNNILRSIKLPMNMEIKV